MPRAGEPTGEPADPRIGEPAGDPTGEPADPGIGEPMGDLTDPRIGEPAGERIGDGTGGSKMSSNDHEGVRLDHGATAISISTPNERWVTIREPGHIYSWG